MALGKRKTVAEFVIEDFVQKIFDKRNVYYDDLIKSIADEVNKIDDLIVQVNKLKKRCFKLEKIAGIN